MDVAEIDEVGGGGDCEVKAVNKSPSKNLNGTTGYLTLNAK